MSSTELLALESLCQTIIKEKQPFERLEVSKEVLLDMFKVISGSSLELGRFLPGVLIIVNIDNFFFFYKWLAIAKLFQAVWPPCGKVVNASLDVISPSCFLKILIWM